MKLKIFLSILILLTLASCSIPVDVPPSPTALLPATPQPTLTAAVGASPIPVLTQIATPLPTSAPGIVTSYCDDPRARDLITSFGKAVANKDGALLAALVSPTTGMDVRIYRDGNVVNYDVEHARFVFETTFKADWGLSYGSGESTLGSFQDIILPSLKIVFTPAALLECNQLKVGGVTYEPVWPYPEMNYYSVHFDGNAGLDWETWAVGMDISSGKPLLAAFVHYVWEP
ncbi:MAG: hypothetical protein HOP27_15840 [Anaerolineales bacterium]|nr:hypothetical protein [Anaerolineales bacterium]